MSLWSDLQDLDLHHVIEVSCRLKEIGRPGKVLNKARHDLKF